MDSLRSSDRYRDITVLCPAEADSFCSDDVKRHGGTVITGDSDLLIYDLGFGGSVVFLGDFDVKTALTEASPTDLEKETSGIPALMYTPSTICEKLALQNGRSLLSFAFELQMDHHLCLKDWVKRANEQHSATTHAMDHETFTSQYLKSPGLDSVVPEYLRFLDPRMSEFILQWTGDAAEAEPTLKGQTAVDNTIFLPHIFDRWDRASAWEASLPIRRLAYTFMQYFPGSPEVTSVVEYRRALSRKSSGHTIELADKTDACQSCQQFLSLAQKFKVDSSSPFLQWVSLCIYQDLAHAAHEEEESLALQLWRAASKSMGRLDPGSWDAIHFTAQLQGMFYSLRMLLQILQALGHIVEDGGREIVDRVKECLSSLPPIVDFPTIEGTENLFAQLEQAGSLAVLADIAGLEAIPFEEESSKKRKSHKQPSSSGKERSRNVADAPLSSNPFDVLQAS